jgi:Spy/CpxP family protein refolding chaperone
MKTTSPRAACLLALAGLLLSPAWLEGQADLSSTSSNDFERSLFAPELIMRHYSEIGLSAEQRTMITNAIRSLQSNVVEPQWELMEMSQTLTELLDGAPVDETRALAAMDQVLAAESEIKRANILALIRIKNALTQEQREQLTRLRRPSWGAYQLLQQMPRSDTAR